ncbi:S9 family peptidase [Candidatus Peregrinibacteria bacterium]|nr:MAG: S9 family peptidase [Candidatus Peregrinibacteria bacterium]
MPTPPFASKIPKTLTKHGHRRSDPYFWLNDRTHPKVIDYLKKENAYTNAMLKPTDKLQKDLFKEMVARVKKDDASVPYKLDGYYHYTRFIKGKDYPLHCRKKGSLKAKEEIILDVNKIAKGKSFCDVGSLNISPRHDYLAYGVDFVSRRQYTVVFKDLKTGTLLKDELKNTTSSVVWAADNKTVFYTLKDPQTLRPHKIMKHRLGTPQSMDELVYEETDDTFRTFVYKTKSKSFIFIGSVATVSKEFRFIPAHQPDATFKLFQKRRRNLEYSVDHANDQFYILTNHQAKNFRLMRTSLEKTDLKNWKSVIPHRPQVRLEGEEFFKRHWVIQQRVNGLVQLKVMDMATKQSHVIQFDEPTYSAWISMNPEFNTTTLRFGYESLTTPLSTFDYSMTSHRKTLKKRQAVLGKFNANDYEAKRMWATASDGVKVPISLVYKKSFTSINRPTLLYGYGSYGITVDPYFSAARLSLLDRGFVFAIAHIRGGEDLGRTWYEDGKLKKKQNTFSDFIACAEHLIQKKITTPQKLCAMGGSAGGLLMGAVINQRPDLFKAVIAAVPFVDVVTTMLDDSIPLTTGEYDEWGNPNKHADYQTMLAYSPYDNVKKQAYPHLLVTTGLHDSQVQYWEPAKWVAKLRTHKTDDNVLLLHTNLKTGHGGASGRFEPYKEVAMEYAFLLDRITK